MIKAINPLLSTATNTFSFWEAKSKENFYCIFIFRGHLKENSRKIHKETLKVRRHEDEYSTPVVGTVKIRNISLSFFYSFNSPFTILDWKH